MRSTDSGYLDEPKDFLKFIQCALDIEKIYNSKFKSKEKESFKWFIATDSDKLRNWTQSKYPDKVFYAKGRVAHVGWDAGGLKRVLLDIELLSRCNEIVVTGGSTFGWIAAMKMLKLPYYITGFSKMETCLRAELNLSPVNRNGAAVFK